MFRSNSARRVPAAGYIEGRGRSWWRHKDQSYVGRAQKAQMRMHDIGIALAWLNLGSALSSEEAAGLCLGQAAHVDMRQT